MLNKSLMNLALKKALDMAQNKDKDIPICAIVAKDDEIISIKTNEKEKRNDVTAHAEILALREANKKLNNWRLDDFDMYVTLEPCPMCAWAIMNARIKNLYFSSYDTQYGAFSSAINLKKLSKSKINVIGGIMSDEGDEILKLYFENLRNEKNAG